MGRQPSVQSPLQKYIFDTDVQKMAKNKYRSFSVLLTLFGFLTLNTFVTLSVKEILIFKKMEWANLPHADVPK